MDLPFSNDLSPNYGSGSPLRQEGFANIPQSMRIKVLEAETLANPPSLETARCPNMAQAA
jgi:hypothetical protein